MQRPRAFIHHGFKPRVGVVHIGAVRRQFLRHGIKRYCQAVEFAQRIVERWCWTLDLAAGAGDSEVDILALDQALDKLDEQSAESRQVVELKYFSGLTEAKPKDALRDLDRRPLTQCGRKSVEGVRERSCLRRAPSAG